MSDLINRRVAIKAIADLPSCYNGFTDAYDKSYIIGVLEELPTVDAVPVKHGKWIEYPNCLAYSGAYDSDWIVCSECEKPFNIIDNCTEEFDYCPNCGARMDEVKG